MQKISIITVNYNNCTGIKKTIKSVLNQDYSSIEYIVIDGGSSDGSVDVIRKYEENIDFWVSELDGGIYQGMNKGIAKATGEYCLFLNSGDCFVNENVLKKIFQQEHEEDLIIGQQIHYSRFHIPRHRHIRKEYLTREFFYCDTLPHQCTFIKRSLLNKSCGYSTDYTIVSDWIFFYESFAKYNATACLVNVRVAIQQEGGVSSNREKCENEINEYLANNSSVFTKDDWMSIRSAYYRSFSYLTATNSSLGRFLVRLAIFLNK